MVPRGETIGMSKEKNERDNVEELSTGRIAKERKAAEGNILRAQGTKRIKGGE